MENEKISDKMTETGKSMDVVVLSKRAEGIQVVSGEGVHSVPCDMTPTRSKQAYVGSVMGREIVYEQSCEKVQEELDKLNPALKKSRRF
jgi:K+/H+ antiporter YhaU regulatory subunit KhtT